ncbi:Protein of unknown function [Pasteurella testudinis DSM 23072]|uniref:Integrating conjugative element membrane protein, PFL_4702 family n=1 Tax=Pasteurella testudinis DSM 23072 TaxID=1122938 RepID=A0A1W1UVH5_9PAST|nr:DUF2976 domain-containing protein [Pasteurella testudinis]SMB85168.1 Protein of unknown function [Pasteurella testudinis DSM 23072]SUB52127.1 integrating conjugative element protein, PFL family [Pasteurella testudinis]
MKTCQSLTQSLSQRYLAFMLLMWSSIQSAFAAPDASKIPDFKIPGVDSETKDVTEILWLIGKAIVTLAAVLLAAGAIFVVVKALISIYNEATSENGRKGWGHFIVALIVGFVVIFFCLYLVRLAVGMF